MNKWRNLIKLSLYTMNWLGLTSEIIIIIVLKDMSWELKLLHLNISWNMIKLSLFMMNWLSFTPEIVIIMFWKVKSWLFILKLEHLNKWRIWWSYPCVLIIIHKKVSFIYIISNVKQLNNKNKHSPALKNNKNNLININKKLC